MVCLYALGTEPGRKHIRGGIWMVATFLATLLVAYIGEFGPMESPLLTGPIDLPVMSLVAVGSFVWSVRAGGPTEELGELLDAQETRDRAEALRVG